MPWSLPRPLEVVPSLKSAESPQTLYPVETELQTPLRALIHKTKLIAQRTTLLVGFCQLDTARVIWKGGTSKIPHQIGLQTSMEGIFLIADGWRRAQSIVRGATLGQAVLGGAEETSQGTMSPRHLCFGSCPEFTS